MRQNPEHGDAANLNEMFEEHLAEIALDWVRAPLQPAPLGAVSWSPANGLITLLAKSQAELIDLTASSAVATSRTIDLTASSAVATSHAIDLTHEPVVMQHAA